MQFPQSHEQRQVCSPRQADFGREPLILAKDAECCASATPWPGSAALYSRRQLSANATIAASRIDSILSTRKDHFDRGSLALRQERRSIALFKNKGAGWTHGKCIEDALVRLAGDRADLATFSINEANNRSTWGACRARRPSWATRSLRCDLILFAGGESQRYEKGEKANGHDGFIPSAAIFEWTNCTRPKL